MATDALLLHIKDHYEIHEPDKLQYFLRGMNDTYILETALEKYIFRVYRADRRSKSDIDFELELLNDLQDKGINVSIPIPRKDGIMINEFWCLRV